MPSLQSIFFLIIYLVKSLKGNIDQRSYRAAHWDGLCSKGKRQSPIDLDIGRAIVMRWTPIQFHNYDVIGCVVASSNGHSELAKEFRSSKKQPYITGGGLGGKYILQQFHFHWGGNDNSGSEHTLGRLHFPMEIHFVHILDGYNATTAMGVPETIAVVAVLLQVAKKGKALMDLEKAFDNANLTNSQTGTIGYNPHALLPKDTATFFRYEGSLTTPPCSEGVIWTVLAEPSYVSKQQLELIRHHLATDGRVLLHGWREIQPLHDRPIYLNKLKLLVSSVKVEDVAPVLCFLLITFTIILVSIHYMSEMDIFN
ncbi:hypothetical protein RB195_011636 [Necator americanus]|uniref:Carbonic anhydrase n=1 Tax=Necator americanus TaxID=51031 RepID=A0ABR1D6K8_NECAM